MKLLASAQSAEQSSSTKTTKQRPPSNLHNRPMKKKPLEEGGQKDLLVGLQDLLVRSKDPHAGQAGRPGRLAVLLVVLLVLRVDQVGHLEEAAEDDGPRKA